MVYTFSIMNATVCNPQCIPTTWSGAVINVGALNPGPTILNLGLRAPSQPRQFTGTTTLFYQGESQPITATVAIHVAGRA